MRDFDKYDRVISGAVTRFDQVDTYRTEWKSRDGDAAGVGVGKTVAESVQDAQRQAAAAGYQLV